MSLSEYEVRKAKVWQLQNLGIVAYAQKYDKKHTVAQLLAHSEETHRDINDIIAAPKVQFSTAWRMTLYRSHGKLSFGKLLDETGEIQLMWQREMCSIRTAQWDQQTLGEWDAAMSAYKVLEKLIDMGDFIGVEWELFMTHKGELTLFVSSYQLLSKALRPLGDKFHGIGDDQENAYRQRYLDMIFNPDTRTRMQLRSKFLQTIRQFYWDNWFMEVETPILGNSASGAAARPFTTHHNDFDIDMFLRISPETNLKKATVGMFEKIFEVAKDFRNEWSDPSHHQEFTMIEHYAAYRNHEDNMKFTEKMFDYVFANIPDLNKTITVIDKQGISKEVSFQTPWPRINYVEQIQKDSGIDVSKYTEDDVQKLRDDITAQWHRREWMEKQGVITLIDYLYKKVTRPKIVWPAFIVNYPKLMQPLARSNDTNPNLVEQRQLLINGREVIKAYSELVDPIEQQANFDMQAAAIEAGDEEATAGDPDFVKAMEYGMPPQSGWGMGIDRIFALLTEQQNIRDVILFPMMKPEGNDKMTEWQNTMQNNNIVTPPLPTVEEAEQIANKYLSDTLRHCQQVAKVMKFFAKKLGQDETYRYIIGLLHDIDRDHVGKIWEKHLKEDFDKIIDSLWIEDSTQLKQDIRSHGPYLTGVEPTTLLQKYLISIDELSGLIHAYSLIRPEWLNNIEWASLNKRIKSKQFAAWVDREHVKNCETYLNIPLDVFAMEVVEAMKE